jgi:hypothetical protein
VVVVVRGLQVQGSVLVFHRLRCHGRRGEHGERLPDKGEKQYNSAKAGRHGAGFYRGDSLAGLADAASAHGRIHSRVTTTSHTTAASAAGPLRGRKRQTAATRNRL